MTFSEQQKLRREGRNKAYENVLGFVLSVGILLAILCGESLLDLIMK